MEEGSLGSALQAIKPGQEGKAPRFPSLWGRLRPLSSTTELKPDLYAPPAEADYVEAAKETDTYWRFFRLRFRSPSLQACFQLHKQAQNKYLFKFRVCVMALLCGPLWLLHLPASSAFEKSHPLFQASFLAWLLVYELPLICSLLLYLWQERNPAAKASKRIESCRFWLEQIGQVGGALTAAFLLLGRSFGQAGVTPCPFPVEEKFHLQIFVASPCNPGAVAGLVPFLETAILLIIPVFFSTISSLARPTLLLLLLLVYGAVCASMVSLSIRSGVQPENILFFIFSLTWILPILSYESQLATNFMHVVGKTQVVVNLYKNFCSLKQTAEYDQTCQQVERQQQWEEAVQRAYQIVSEQIFRDLRSDSAPSSQRELPRALTSPDVLVMMRQDLNTDGGLAELPQQDNLTTQDAIDWALHPPVQNDRFLPPDCRSGHSVSLSNETQFRAKQAEMKTNMGKLTSNSNNNNNKSFLRGQLLGKEAMTKDNMNDSDSSAGKATEDVSSLYLNNLAEEKREYSVTPQSEILRIQERVYGSVTPQSEILRIQERVYGRFSVRRAQSKSPTIDLQYPDSDHFMIDVDNQDKDNENNSDDVVKNLHSESPSPEDESVCLALTRDLLTAGPRDCAMSSTVAGKVSEAQLRTTHEGSALSSAAHSKTPVLPLRLPDKLNTQV